MKIMKKKILMKTLKKKKILKQKKVIMKNKFPILMQKIIVKISMK